MRAVRMRGKRALHRKTLSRQKLSFFLVVFFFGIFGLIMLVEFFNVNDGNGFMDDNGYVRPRSHRMHMATDEIERLVHNISTNLEASAKASGIDLQSLVRTSMKPPTTFNYSSADRLSQEKFDLDLQGRHTGLDATWQPVLGSKNKFYVYSAFLDTRGEKNVIRVIGATLTKTKEQVWCRLATRQEDSLQITTVKAKIAVIRENWNLKYSAVFVICPLDNFDSLKLAQSVSVLAHESEANPGNQLQLLNTEVKADVADQVLRVKDEIGVCVKPIHYHFNKTQALVEFIELNRILGVSKFTFYDSSISDQTRCLLNDYQQRGIVQVLPWKLNMKSQVEIRTEGLFAALNDCLYRNMYHFQYLMLIDIDEFVVPKVNQTLQAMLKHVREEKAKAGLPRQRPHLKSVSKATKALASFSFQNSFFYLGYPDDPEAKHDLMVLKKTTRKAKFHPHKQRSKYICVPRLINEAGNHFIWEYFDGGPVNVDPGIGFLHHYRSCEFGGVDCINTASVVDKTIKKRYEAKLVDNFDQVMSTFKEKCASPPVTLQSSDDSHFEYNQSDSLTM